jgi:hypothetical protein
MLSLEIDCPAGGNVLVTSGSGSCSGAVGTICVRGQYFDTFGGPPWLARLVTFLRTLIRWLVGLFRRKPVGHALRTGLFVRVRVLNGSVSMGSLPHPNPKQCWDVDTTPSGQSWCARGVQVPAFSASGAPLTVVAWLMNADGSPASCPAASTLFNGGGQNPYDCCSGCGSGSGAGTSVVARELASHGPLEVAVSDGPNAGLHRATAVASYTWEVTIRGVNYQLCCDPGDTLVIRGPSSSAPSKSVEGSPFSATFPGAALGAGGDVVVTKA